MDAGDLGIRFSTCSTGLGIWRPGFLSLYSAVDFLNNLSELHRPTFRVWQPEFSAQTHGQPQSWLLESPLQPTGPALEIGKLAPIL